MSNFVGAVAAYIELEASRLPQSPADLLRAFGGAPRQVKAEQLATWEQEIARESGLKKASVRRRLQRWGYVSVGEKIGKQARGPLAKARGGISKKVQDELRRILIARRDAPTRITISGTVCWDAGGSRKCKRYHSTVEPVGERALLDILKVAHVSAASRSGVEPPLGGGERGEEAACNILTGYWFDHDPEDISCDGAVVARQPYHDVMEYSDEVVFVIERIRASRSVA